MNLCHEDKNFLRKPQELQTTEAPGTFGSLRIQIIAILPLPFKT